MNVGNTHLCLRRGFMLTVLGYSVNDLKAAIPFHLYPVSFGLSNPGYTEKRTPRRGV